MKKSEGFNDHYFEFYRGYSEQPIRYGDHFESYSLIDDTDRQLMRAIDKVFLYECEEIEINSVLDVGCANGAKIKRLHDHYGLDAFGIENADWARRNVIPEYEDRITFDDCRRCLHQFETDSIDLVLDCSTKYLPEADAKKCVEEYFRIARKVVVSTLSSTDQRAPDEAPDAYQVLFRTTDWWMNLFRSMDECRFTHKHMFYLVAGVDFS